MPKQTYEDLIAKADTAIEHAQNTRAHHRFKSKRGNAMREADIRIALARLRSSMDPIRQSLGRVQFESASQARLQKQQSLREASLAIQRERRKLWKMQDHQPRGAR